MSPLETIKYDYLPTEKYGYPLPVKYDFVLDQGNIRRLVRQEKVYGKYIFTLFGTKGNMPLFVFADAPRHEDLEWVMIKKGVIDQKIADGQMEISGNYKILQILFNDYLSEYDKEQEELIGLFLKHIDIKLFPVYERIPVAFGKIGPETVYYIFYRKLIKKQNLTPSE